MKFIFDVDGTLTPSRGIIDRDFEIWFKEFIKQYSVSLVTGSDREKTIEQLGLDIVNSVEYCFNCSGNAVYQQEICVYTNEWDCPDDLWQFLEDRLYSSRYSQKYGKHFEKRIGMLNFSVVGRNAKGTERTDYYEWDKIHNEREMLSREINNRWPNIQAVVGGETGIDIFEKGRDKSQILKYFSDRIYFFGDRIDPAGNDYTLAKAIIDNNRGICYNVNNWTHTWNTLKQLCPNVSVSPANG